MSEINFYHGDSLKEALKIQLKTPSCEMNCDGDRIKLLAIDRPEENTTADRVVGKAKVAEKFCRFQCEPLWLEVKDYSGLLHLKVNLNRAKCGVFHCGGSYKIYNAGNVLIGKIKPIRHCLKRCFPCIYPIREYLVTFPPNIDPHLKALLIGICYYVVCLHLLHVHLILVYLILESAGEGGISVNYLFSNFQECASRIFDSLTEKTGYLATLHSINK